MTDTVHVMIGQGDDEQLYAYEASVGDAADATDLYEADVPAELWDEVNKSWKTLEAAFDRIREIAGIDPDDWRLKAPCAAWAGHVRPARSWVNVIIPASGDENTWPLSDYSSGTFDTEAEAQAFVASLPQEFVYSFGSFLRVIDRDSLRLETQGWSEHVSECTVCGWSRDEHTPIEDHA